MTEQPRRDDETPKARIDRELMELLNEIRVALPGVEVLFGFLLILPFSGGWERVGGHTDVYFLAVLATATAIALLIAPTAHHRLRFRDPVKEQMLHMATKLVVAGLGMTALAVSLILYVVVDVLYTSTVGAVTAGAFAFVVALLWFVVPRFYKESDPAG